MKVLKDITTPTSHFPAGADITADDLDGPLTAADWARLGHLEEEKPPATPRATKPATATPVAPLDPALTD